MEASRRRPGGRDVRRRLAPSPPQRNLLGENLLAAGVDHLRAAAQEAQGAVGVDGGEVAGHRPAPALERREGLGRLLRVLVVAERQEAGEGQQAALAGARLDAPAVLGEGRRIGPEGSVAGRRRYPQPRTSPGCRTARSRPAGISAGPACSHGSTPCRTSRSGAGWRGSSGRGWLPAAPASAGRRPGRRWRWPAAPHAVDLAPQLAGVQGRQATAPRAEGGELRCAVHQRRGGDGQAPRLSPRSTISARSPASAASTWNRSSSRHITPLGMPVVPPV